MLLALVLCALPLTLDEKHVPGALLPEAEQAEHARKLAFIWPEAERQRRLAAVNAKADAVNRLTFSEGPVFEFAGTTWRVVFLRAQDEGSVIEHAYAITPQGYMRLATWSKVNERSSQQGWASIATDGKVAWKTTTTTALNDLGGEAPVLLRTESGGTTRLQENGRWVATGPDWFTTNHGRFEDPQTHEKLTLLDDGVFYQSPKQPGALQLKVEGDFKSEKFKVRFPKSPKAYVLFMELPNRHSIVCVNPDRSEQRFERVY